MDDAPAAVDHCDCVLEGNSVDFRETMTLVIVLLWNLWTTLRSSLEMASSMGGYVGSSTRVPRCIRSGGVRLDRPRRRPHWAGSARSCICRHCCVPGVSLYPQERPARAACPPSSLPLP